MVRAFAGDSTITRGLAVPLVAAVVDRAAVGMIGSAGSSRVRSSQVRSGQVNMGVIPLGHVQADVCLSATGRAS